MREIIKRILIEHLNEQRTPKWTKESAHQEALKYGTRNEFKRGNQSAYQAAWKNKWLDDITTHMIPVGNLHRRMIYAYEFPDNSVYVGLTFNRDTRDKSHTDVNNIYSPVARHRQNTGLIPKYIEISEYIDAQQAQNLENCTIEKYKQEGWTILNTSKGGSLGRCQRFWTKEMIYKEALKYDTKNEFRQGSNSAFQIASRNGWLDDITKHMTPVDRVLWTYDKTKEFAKKFDSRYKMFVASPAAYNRARRQGWLDDFFPKNNNE